MTFSAQVKENLSKMHNLADKEAVKSELLGYFMSNNIHIQKTKIVYTTTNEYNINRFGKLLSNCQIDFQITLKGKKYSIIFDKKVKIEKYNLEEFMQEYVQKMQEKAFIRGIFLGGGSVNNPENKYHLELIVSLPEYRKIVQNVLEKNDISVKHLERKNGYSLYIKDGEEISKFFAFIEATFAVLKFEEIRVLHDVKNRVNRKVNCETANLSKTVNAAVKQIEAIKNLQKRGEFNHLPENLKEIAILRLENPDASLTELGKMLKEPIGKSGVNHRLKALLDYAKKGEKN